MLSAATGALPSKPLKAYAGLSLRHRALLIQLGVAGMVLLAWEIGGRTGLIDKSVMPPFSGAVRTLVSLLRDGAFLSNLGDTLVRVGVAFLIGTPLAIVAGLIIGERGGARRLLSPLISFALAIPQSIFLPLFILALGIGDLQKIVFGITHIVFVVMVNTIAAVQSVPRPLVVAARSFGASPARIYRSVYLPAMLPLILSGVRMGMTFNVVGILLAEMYASQSGVGMLIFRWGESYDVDRLTAALLLVSLFTIAFNEVLRSLERRLGRWQPASHR